MLQDDFYKRYGLAPQVRSLSVASTGHQHCIPGYQWGPGVLDHYCLYHILSGHGNLLLGERHFLLEAGDSFLVYPDTTVQFMRNRLSPGNMYGSAFPEATHGNWSNRPISGRIIRFYSMFLPNRWGGCCWNCTGRSVGVWRARWHPQAACTLFLRSSVKKRSSPDVRRRPGPIVPGWRPDTL